VAKENCFHEPFKTIKTVRISKFIRQRVPDCQAGIIECLTAVGAECVEVLLRYAGEILLHVASMCLSSINQSWL